jgi:hypothetical protein
VGVVSVESMAIALNHSRAKGVARLVLIGICNHDGDGGAWPSIAKLQRYAGNVDRRTVQRAVDELERLGEVQRIIQQGGDHTTGDGRRPNLYRVRLECPGTCDRSRNHRVRDEALPLELDETGAAWTPPLVIHRGGVDAAGRGGVDAALTTLSTTPTGQALDATTEGEGWDPARSLELHRLAIAQKCPKSPRRMAGKHFSTDGYRCDYCARPTADYTPRSIA